MNAIYASLAGMNAAASNFERASQKLVNAFQGGADKNAIEAIVEQKKAEFAFMANAAALHASSRMSKALLDILA